MHFSEDIIQDSLFIREYKNGHIKTNAWEFNESIVLYQNEAIDNILPHIVEDLNETHLHALASLKPELVIIGTGVAQHFPHAQIFTPFHKNRIGFEIMSTDAACRTFNLLLAEGRSVLAALFV